MANTATEDRCTEQVLNRNTQRTEQCARRATTDNPYNQGRTCTQHSWDAREARAGKREQELRKPC